jgi:hypothetical protein
MPTDQPDHALDSIDRLIDLYNELTRQARAVIATADDTNQPPLLEGVRRHRGRRRAPHHCADDGGWRLATGLRLAV